MPLAWTKSLLFRLLLSLGLGLCLHWPCWAQEPLFPGMPAIIEEAPPIEDGVPLPPRPPRPFFWAEGDLLIWSIQEGPLPIPVLASGDPTDPIPGALGQPGTQVIFGNQGLDYGQKTGLRLTVGTWLPRFPRLGFEFGGFWLDRQSTGFVTNGDAAGNPPVYVPAFRPELDREGSFTISDPVLLLNGSGVFASQSQLWGLEANSLFQWRQNSAWDINFLGGLRYLVLEEDFTFNTFLRDPLLDINTTTRDLFATENRFFGGQVGSRVRYRLGRWTFDLTGKLAFGVNHENVIINGSLTQSGIGVPFAGTFPGGVFTQASNIGIQSRDEFVVIPQVTLKANFEIAPRLHLFGGYDFLWWSSVVRPGEQIDRNINRTQQAGGMLVGPALPAPLFNTSSFWAQGINVGVAVRY